MSTESLIRVRIKTVSSASRLNWAEGMQFSLPYTTLVRSRLIENLDTDGNLVIPSEVSGIAIEESESLRFRAVFTDRKPLSSRLPISYQSVPPWFRSFLASLIGRWKRHSVNRWAAFPRWPLDLSADFLADLVSAQSSPFAAKPTPVLLTHDLDSSEGLENLVKWFLDAEESAGARSINFIVPCAWPVDHGLLSHVKERGHEVGIHGYDHSNRTPFSDPMERRERLEGARQLVERYGMIGYRAPSLLRTRDFLRDLADFYRYDSSIPTSGGLFPVPNNGCASARPFWVEGIPELPLSLPRDGSLLFLGHSPQEIVEIWIRCAEEISCSGGIIVLLTHCEYRFSGNPPMIEAYRRFLDFIASSERFVWSTSKEVLEQALGIELS